MEKLPMCRICLVENVRMFEVVNRNLHELYEKLTDNPFVTEDSRPILACFFCCAKLKQCYRLLRQCLEAEELFAQMMNEAYKLNPLLSQDHLEFCGAFIKSPIVHISIDDECQTGSIAIKEELPAVCEGLDDIIEPKEEHQSDELELENNIIPHHSESDLEDYVPLIKLKTEVEEEQEVSKNEQRARQTTKQCKKPTYKYCIVPKCRNTIRNAPDKVFFFVPRGSDIRRNWCNIMKRDMVSPSTCLYCCEDHFDIEEDTDNYMMYKILYLQEKQKTTLRLKKGIVPHKFKCQNDTESQPPPLRKGFLKRKHLVII